VELNDRDSGPAYRSNSRELVLAKAPTARWRNHPIPASAIRTPSGRNSRSRRRRLPKGFFRIERAPVILAAAGVAASLCLAMIFPAVESRLMAASVRDNLPACVEKAQAADMLDLPPVLH
jgi:hypothetical protein